MLSKNDIEIDLNIYDIFKPRGITFEPRCNNPIADLVNTVINSKKEEKSASFKFPKRYIINKGATILFWEDGSKTIVRKCADDKYDKRLGFLTAYFQKNCGLSKNKANKFLSELVEEIAKE